NSGTVTKTGASNATLNITFNNLEGGDFEIDGGTITNIGTFTNAGNMVFDGGIFATSGTMSHLTNANVSGQGTFNQTGGSHTVNSSITIGSTLTLNQSGIMVVANGQTVTIDGIWNWDRGQVQGPGTIVLSKEGTLNLTPVEGKFFSGTPGEFNNNGTVNLSGQAVFFNSAFTINNAGKFNISSSSGLFGATGTINNSGTTTKTGAGNATISVTFNNTGEILGIGGLTFNTVLNNQGIIGPGLSTGVLAINGLQPLSANSTLVIEIQDNSGPGTGHDQLARAGALTLAGTLNVSEIGDVPGDSYTIVQLSSGAISGNFSAINLPDGYSIETTSNAIILTKTADPCENSIAPIIIADVTETCPGGTVILSTDEAVSYLWSNGATTQTVEVGPGEYTVTTIDENGCSAVSDLLVITAVDTEAPAIPEIPNLEISADTDACSAIEANLTIPEATDNCSIASLTNDAPEEFPLGTTVVTWTAIDATGNLTTRSFNVIVKDNQAPVINAPANINIQIQANEESATDVDLGTPITSDNCGVEEVSNDAPTTFAVGTTTVIWTVTDVNGNTATASQTVTVTREVLPTIAAPANITVSNNEGICGATGIDLGSPTVTGEDIPSDGISNNAQSSFPVGTTTVIWTVTDGNGNTATAQQSVTVTDEESPVIAPVAIITRSNDPGSCDAEIEIDAPAVSDNCDNPTATGTRSDGLALNAPYPVGSTQITWAASDAAGNEADEVVQTVTVIDTEAPEITSPANISIQVGESEESATDVDLGTPLTSENCGVEEVSSDAPTTFAVGTTTVIWTVTDVNGNTATASQTVTVTKIILPIITAPTDIEVDLATSTVPFDEEICVTATVLDQFGEVMEGIEVFLEINGQASGSAITNEEGAAEFCETFEIKEQDGQDGDGQRILSFYYAGGARVNSVITLTRILIIPVPTLVRLAPVDEIITIGEQICFDLGVLDQFVMPLGGADFFIELNGNVVDEVTSGQDGKYQYCFTSNTAGQFTFGFYTEGGVKVLSVLNVVDVQPIPTILNISLSQEQIQVGEELCLAVTVLDQFGLPVVGSDVTLDVDGVFYKRDITDENGRLDFCITPQEAGVLVFDATVDEELQESASVLVTEESTSQQPIPTTLNLSVSDKQVDAGEDICLTVTVLDQFGLPIVGEEVSLAINGQDSGKGFTWEYGRATFCLGTNESGVIMFDVTVNEDLKGTISVLVTDESINEIAIKAFALVDADKNQIVREIKEGDELLFSEIKDLTLSFVAIADPEVVGSVWIEMEFQTECETCPTSKTGRVENVIPYALFGDINSNYNGRKLSSGEYTLYAKPFAKSNRQGEVGSDYTVNFTIKYDMEVSTFVLVDSHTNQDVQKIRDGDVLDLAKLGDIRFNIRGEADKSPIGSMKMEIEGPFNSSIFERVAPYALFGDNKGNYSGRKLPLGKYTLKAKAYPNSASNSEGFGGEIATIQFEVISGFAVTSYTLVNADINEDIMELKDQDVLDLNKYGLTRLSIRANTVGEDINNVVMMLSGPFQKTIRERVKPYTLFGDLAANHYNGRRFNPGDYELTSTPYDRNSLAGGAKTIRFTAKYGENLRVVLADQVLEEKESESEDALESGKITIYPQPSNGVVNFNYPSELAENTSVQIIDSNGRIIYGGVVGKTPAFDFRNYGSGLFLLIINTDNETLKHKILIH
nr:HYR domain-containing protein [Cytophagales bacterium]